MTEDTETVTSVKGKLIDGDELAKKLYELPPDRFMELYRLYERLGWQTEVNDEMGILRQRLVRMRPRRAPTMKRVLCRPFEFFIGDDPEIAPYHVPRHCCDELGDLAVELIGKERAAKVDAEIRALDPENLDGLAGISERLWHVVGTALDAMDDASRKSLSLSLRAAFDLITGCILMGGAMAVFSGGGSRDKIKRLDARGREQLSRMVSRVPEPRQALLQYPLVMLSRRLENPAEIINIIQRKDIAMPSQVRQLLTEMMEDHLEKELKVTSEHVKECIAQAVRDDAVVDMDTLTDGIRMATDSKNAGVAVKASRELLDRISEHVSRDLIEPSAQRLETDLGLYLAGQELTLENDGQSNPFDTDTNGLADAEDCLLTLSELSKHGQALSLSADLTRIFSDWSLRISEEAEGRVLEIRNAAASSMAQTQLGELYGLVRLLEILDGPDRAEDIRRRGEKAVEKILERA